MNRIYCLCVPSPLYSFTLVSFAVVYLYLTKEALSCSPARTLFPEPFMIFTLSLKAKLLFLSETSNSQLLQFVAVTMSSSSEPRYFAPSMFESLTLLVSKTSPSVEYSIFGVVSTLLS